MKKKRTCNLVDLFVPVDNMVKIKESKKKMDKYLDLARELKKLWNMKKTLISVLAGVLGIFPKIWKKELRNWKSEDKSRSSKE